MWRLWVVAWYLLDFSLGVVVEDGGHDDVDGCRWIDGWMDGKGQKKQKAKARAFFSKRTKRRTSEFALRHGSVYDWDFVPDMPRWSFCEPPLLS